MTDPACPDNRKLIEVALPLTEISAASQADKNRRTGTIRNLHKWFAPMPLPALRALIFAALVDDPGTDTGRNELLEVIKTLVPEEGTAPPDDALCNAVAHIRRCNPDLPTVLDPFAGTGTTLIEALRLGLPAVGSDLNPVPALISRTLTELLPALAGVPAVHANADTLVARPFDGLAADLRHYGELVGLAVEKRLGWAYPATPSAPVAWLWARTAPCGNPACGLRFPLFGSPWLSKQRGREVAAGVEVMGERVHFVLERGSSARGASTKAPGRASFRCPRCSEILRERDLRRIGQGGNLGLQLMAVCIDTSSGRDFLPADAVDVPSKVPVPDDLDDLQIGANTRDLRTPLYGLPRQSDLYTSRQLAVLAAFADEVAVLSDRVLADGGTGEQAVTIASVLGLAVGRLAQSNSMLVRWFVRDGPSKAQPAFGTQAMPMLWDFAECYPFGGSVGSWRAQVESAIIATRYVPATAAPARVVQEDARRAGTLVTPGSAFVVTDPPYFAQINYADLSDYFYLWLRRAAAGIHPDLFATLATPKASELVANPARHGGSKEAARRYFIEGFTEVFASLRRASRPDLPMVVVYAHKQDEETVDGILSSGWESLLQAVLAAGLGVVGTWPIEASQSSRQVGVGTNALASYVVIVCRSRDAAAATIDRRGFLIALRAELPERLRELQQGNVAPVDLAQAAIGPGMAVFSRYRQVTELDGTPMRVRDALIEINRVLGEVLYEQEGDFDSDTRWCVKWFEEFGWDRGDYGRAETLANAFSTSVSRMARAGVLRKPGGDVWLIRPAELDDAYDPATDLRPTVWEGTLHLVKRLEEHGVEAAGRLMGEFGTVLDVDAVKELAYLLYNVCERKRRTETARLLNSLVTSWADITAASRPARIDSEQLSMDA